MSTCELSWKLFLPSACLFCLETVVKVMICNSNLGSWMLLGAVKSWATKRVVCSLPLQQQHVLVHPRGKPLKKRRFMFRFQVAPHCIPNKCIQIQSWIHSVCYRAKRHDVSPTYAMPKSLHITWFDNRFCTFTRFWLEKQTTRLYYRVTWKPNFDPLYPLHLFTLGSFCDSEPKSSQNTSIKDPT